MMKPLPILVILLCGCGGNLLWAAPRAKPRRADAGGGAIRVAAPPVIQPVPARLGPPVRGATAPEIFSLDPAEGAAEQPIVVKGSGLKGTRQVWFCVKRVVREAKFTVVSDEELQVIAPQFFQSGASATVVVVTANGATVAMPPSALIVDGLHGRGRESASFYHVKQGGVLTGHSGLVFVDDGGIGEAHFGADVSFVRRGGTLDIEHFTGLVFHEPGSTIRAGQQQRNPSVRFIEVPEITISQGIEPFFFLRPEVPEQEAKTAPKVRSVRPENVSPGAIVTLTGTGFLETSSVIVIGDQRTSRDPEAGFRVVSDTKLEVELPDLAFGNPILVVCNPLGAAVVVSQHHVDGGMNGRPLMKHLQIVKPHALVKSGGGGAMYFVEKGGIVAETGGGGLVFFVKDGGRVSAGGGGGQIVFHEPDADLGGFAEGRKGGNMVREVKSLTLDVLPHVLEVTRH